MMQKYEVRREKTGRRGKEAKKVEVEKKEDEEFDDFMRQDSANQYNLTWTEQHIIRQKEEKIESVIRKNKDKGDPFDFPDLHEVVPLEGGGINDNLDRMKKLSKQNQGFHGKQQQKKNDIQMNEEIQKKQIKNQIRNRNRKKNKQISTVD